MILNSNIVLLESYTLYCNSCDQLAYAWGTNPYVHPAIMRCLFVEDPSPATYLLIIFRFAPSLRTAPCVSVCRHIIRGTVLRTYMSFYRLARNEKASKVAIRKSTAYVSMIEVCNNFVLSLVTLGSYVRTYACIYIYRIRYTVATQRSAATPEL